jgi:plasmid stabilization system protein ParE
MGKKVKQIVRSPFARSTLQIIYNFIAEQSPRDADKQLDRIFERTQLLKQGWAKINYLPQH